MHMKERNKLEMHHCAINVQLMLLIILNAHSCSPSWDLYVNASWNHCKNYIRLSKTCLRWTICIICIISHCIIIIILHRELIPVYLKSSQVKKGHERSTMLCSSAFFLCFGAVVPCIDLLLFWCNLNMHEFTLGSFS